MHDFTVPKWLYLSPPSYNLNRADELCLFSPLRLLFPFLAPFFLISQMATTVSLILQRTHFTRNKCILLFTDLVIYALCGFSCSFQFIYLCLYVCVSSVCQCLRVCVEDFTSICICACARAVFTAF